MIELRPMLPTDYPSIRRLWETTPGITISDGDSEAEVSAFLLRNPAASLVATTCGRIIGGILAGYDGRRAWLYHVVVEAEFRRSGIGRQLVEGSLSRLRELGIVRIHLFVMADNPEGRDFWHHLGWDIRDDIQLLFKKL